MGGTGKREVHKDDVLRGRHFFQTPFSKQGSDPVTLNLSVHATQEGP